MRSIIVGFGCLLVVGCGGFGAASPDDSSAASGSDPAGSPPASNNTPADNAKGGTPVGGEAPRGVFVSASSGSDAGSGSQDHPLKSLAKAIMLAHEKNLPVNACAEIYEEQLTVGDGVSMYGYFDCSVSPWARGTVRATVKSPTSPALVAEHLAFATRIEGFDFRAPDGTASDPTSIGARIISSKNLTISQALVHAGSGADGTDGAAPAVPANSFTVAAAASGQGVGACPNAPAIGVCTGPAGGTNICSAGAPGGAGGQGGDGRWYINGAEFGVGWDFHGRGGNASTAAGGGNLANDGNGGGLRGTDGVNGNDGADGVNGHWQLSKTGFVSGDGTVGSAASVGQGGGGGGGTKWFRNMSPAPAGNSYTSSGGAGGAGGCAGQAGEGGKGGGASIGALVIDSEVAFEQARIESAAGGGAGAGSLGSDGTAGQTGGNPFVVYISGIVGAVTAARGGGNGGRGGVGGASGHGAPGPSIALAFSGTRPTLTSTDLTPGPAGRGQPELRRTTSSGDKVLPAVMGLSEAEHTIE